MRFALFGAGKNIVFKTCTKNICVKNIIILELTPLKKKMTDDFKINIIDDAVEESFFFLQNICLSYLW